MTAVFLKLLNMSITASWTVLAVVLLRGVCKKAPKWISCLFWGTVALRLMLPVTPVSVFSLIPSGQVIPENIVQSQTPAIYSGIPAVNNTVNPMLTTYISPGSNTLAQILQAASLVWVVGFIGMLVYSAVSYWKLRRQVQASLLLRDNIYRCDMVQSPFVLGVFRPRIYIPSGLEQAQLPYVLAHEQAHIRRRDHWWKPIGFLLLSIYWFNPLLWLAYILLCRDIEQACDEKVITAMDSNDKMGYLEALAACSARQRMVMACPIAFGEVGVKDRIKNILHYKKPAFWVILAAMVACVVVMVCFLTDPTPCTHQYAGKLTTVASCTETGVMTYTCEHCKHRYTETVPLLAHTYDAGVVIQQSTCIEEGTKERHCTVCGAATTESVEKAAHTPGEPMTVTQPNCTEKGVRSATCTVCQAVFVAQVLETNGVHDLQETVAQAPTCTAPGEGVKKCSRCDYSETCAYAQLEHTFQDGMLLPSTCVKQGQKQRVCTGCRAETWETLPLSDAHHWIEGGYHIPTHCMYCNKKKSDSTVSYQSNYSLLDGVSYSNTPTYINTGDPFSRMGTTSVNTGKTNSAIQIWP